MQAGAKQAKDKVGYKKFLLDSKAKIPIFKTGLLSMKFLFHKIISWVYFLTKGVGDFNVNLSTQLTQKGGYTPPPFFVSSNSNSNELLSVNSSYSYSAAAAAAASISK